MLPSRIRMTDTFDWLATHLATARNCEITGGETILGETSSLTPNCLANSLPALAGVMALTLTGSLGSI